MPWRSLSSNYALRCILARLMFRAIACRTAATTIRSACVVSWLIIVSSRALAIRDVRLFGSANWRSDLPRNLHEREERHATQSAIHGSNENGTQVDGSEYPRLTPDHTLDVFSGEDDSEDASDPASICHNNSDGSSFAFGERIAPGREYITQSQRFMIVQDLIRYKFISPKWLVWAIDRIDAEYNGQVMADTQQYLALIGDAMIKTAYYAHNFPFATLSGLHGPFANVSSNMALAAIMYDSGLLGIIRPSMWNGYPDAKLSVWTIATILEAIVGAVYMDSGKDYNATKLVIENILRLAGVGDEDGSTLDVRNCAKRKLQRTSQFNILNPLHYAKAVENLPLVYKHLKLSDMIGMQNSFMALRRRQARILGKTVPQDFDLQQEFCHFLYASKNLQQIIRDERTALEKLKRASLRTLDGGRSSVADAEVQSDDVDWRNSLADELDFSASRLDFLARNEVVVSSETESEPLQRKKIEKILGYEFKDSDLLRMAVTYQNSSYHGRNVPKSDEHLAHIGANILEVAFYQHNLSHATFGVEMQHAFLAISSYPNLALICDATGLAKAVFPEANRFDIRSDIKNPPPSNKSLAVTLRAIVGAVWVDSGSNYQVTKSVIERLLQQEGDEEKAGCPLDWERVLVRRNTWWPRILRRESPVKHHFAGIELELDYNRHSAPSVTSRNTSTDTEASPLQSKPPMSLELEIIRCGLVAFVNARWQAADNMGIQRAALDDLIREYDGTEIPRRFLVKHAEAEAERTRLEAGKSEVSATTTVA